MNELVSVVVPVYRTARYLPKCIESILHQSYSALQVILIDDGSTDSSGAICDRYAKKDARVEVIHLDENAGPSVARNAGMNAVKGKYLMFCDSDDWMPTCAVEKLLRRMKETGAELTFGQLLMIVPKQNQMKTSVCDAVYRLSDAEEWVDYLKRINVGPCAKLFLTEIVRRQELSFDSEIFYAEDALFLYRYLSSCSLVSSVSDVVYYYNQLLSTSLTHSYHSEFHYFLFRCQQEYEQVIRLARDGVHDQMIDAECARRATERFLGVCQLYLSYLKDSDEAEKKLKESCGYFGELIDLDSIPAPDRDSLAAILDFANGKTDFKSIYPTIYEGWELSSRRGPIKTLVRNMAIECKKAMLFDFGRRKFDL